MIMGLSSPPFSLVLFFVVCFTCFEGTDMFLPPGVHSLVEEEDIIQIISEM